MGRWICSTTNAKGCAGYDGIRMVWLGGGVRYRVVRSSVGDAGRLHPAVGVGVGEGEA